MEILQREFTYLWYYFTVLIQQIAPYWALGILLGSVISVFGKDKINNLFISMQKKNVGIIGIFLSSILGIISPICMYGTIPIAASFSKKGMPQDWLAAFMMSSVLLNPQLIIYSASLGTTILLIRIITCLLCGIVAGLLIKFIYKNKPFFSFNAFEEPVNKDTDSNLFVRLLKNIWRNIKATSLYYLLGVILSVLFISYIHYDC